MQAAYKPERPYRARQLCHLMSPKHPYCPLILMTNNVILQAGIIKKASTNLQLGWPKNPLLFGQITVKSIKVKGGSGGGCSNCVAITAQNGSHGKRKGLLTRHSCGACNTYLPLCYWCREGNVPEV